MTYTVLTHNGDLIDTGLTADEAARAILTYDGCDFELRPIEDGGFALWSRQQVANKPWQKSLILWSIAENEKEAEADIFVKVLKHSSEWRHSPYAITDESYAADLADAEESEDE